MLFRIGIGYDIHRLVKGRKLFIGGIQVPSAKGSLGHSDGDVLLHAICDALLGAAGEGDIGEHFPDSASKYRNISSIKLLKRVADLLKGKGFLVNNVDAVVMLEEPRLAFFKKKMRKKIALALKIKEERVNLKAGTNEGLGEIGEKRAVASYAAVSIRRRPPFGGL